MNKIFKRIAVMGAAVIMITGSAIASEAAYKQTKNNTGNSCPYKGSIDISLGWYTMNNGAIGNISSDHTVLYSKPEVTVQPYNNYTSKNRVVYYAEWKEDGEIEDKITKTYDLKNNEPLYRDLSDGMKLFTWDSDITYFRTDIYPYNGLTTEQRALTSDYSRRASTDITH